GDPRLVQGVLEWPTELTAEPFVVIRTEDGRWYYADIKSARRLEPAALTVGARVAVLGTEAARPHEITALVFGSGDAAALAIAGGGVLVSVGEVNAATNRLWCELLHRTLNRSKRARQSRPRSRTPRTSTGLRLITESAAPRRPEMETGECDRGEEGRRSTA